MGNLTTEKICDLIFIIRKIGRPTAAGLRYMPVPWITRWVPAADTNDCESRLSHQLSSHIRSVGT